MLLMVVLSKKMWLAQSVNMFYIFLHPPGGKRLGMFHGMAFLNKHKPYITCFLYACSAKSGGLNDWSSPSIKPLWNITRTHIMRQISHCLSPHITLHMTECKYSTAEKNEIPNNIILIHTQDANIYMSQLSIWQLIKCLINYVTLLQIIAVSFNSIWYIQLVEYMAFKLLYLVSWNPWIVPPPSKKGQPLNKGHMTTMQACYFLNK